MNKWIKSLAYRISEGYLTPSLIDGKRMINAFHRKVYSFESTDLSYIIGLSLSGLRSTASIQLSMLPSNMNQLMMASRLHVPLVVNVSSQFNNTGSSTNNFSSVLKSIRTTGCFQFIANSALETIYLTLIAHHVAEKSLVPGIVISDYKEINDDLELPSDDLLVEYLGNPDDYIECPTPAQELIFGKTRRRIPAWYNYDVPVQLGVLKDPEGIAFENAARKAFFTNHLEGIIEDSFEKFESIFKVDFKAVDRTKDYPNAIVSYSGKIQHMDKQSGLMPGKTDFIHLRQLYPLPKEKLRSFLEKKKSITILDDACLIGEGNSLIEEEIKNLFNASHREIYTAALSPDFSEADLKNMLGQMVNDGQGKNYFLGLSFLNSSSKYPKQEVHFQSIKNHYPGLTELGLVDLDKEQDKKLILEDLLPETIKKNLNRGPLYSRLSHFYETKGFFIKHDLRSETVADPLSALAVLPSSSAELFVPNNKKGLPSFDPRNCTACGKCYMLCPHSALPAVAIGVDELMKSGAKMVESEGKIITKLVPHYKNISRLVSNSINGQDTNKVEGLLNTAFEKLKDNLDLDTEDEKLLNKEFSLLMEKIGRLPVTVNDILYSAPSKVEAGSGKLFSINVNPLSCTGCGICQDVCEDEAISMNHPVDDYLEESLDKFRLWEQLSDTTSKTINQLHLDDKFNSLAAILLSRNYYMSMTGYNPDESSYPAKSILHLIVSISEATLQPGVVSQLNQIEKLIEDLSENIHKEISDALPDDDITGLEEVLKGTSKKRILVRDIVDNIRDHGAGKYIQTKNLERKIDLIKSLKELYNLVKEGPNGFGRSRLGMLVPPTTKFNWAGNYPFNNFPSPSIKLSNSNSTDIALGLIYGQMRFILDQVKLLRRAALEIKGKYDPAVHDLQISQLEWNDLSDEEKNHLPKLLLLIDQQELLGTSWQNIIRLLSYSLPVKVVCLDSGTRRSSMSKAEMTDIWTRKLALFSLSNTLVYQGTLNKPDKFFDSISRCIKSSGSSFINVYVPDPGSNSEQGPGLIGLSDLAEKSRMFPSFSFLADDHNDMYNFTPDISNNEAFDSNWNEVEIKSEVETKSYRLSWADWAIHQESWRQEFKKHDQSSSGILLTDYLELNQEERKSRVPVILVSENEQVSTYALSEEAVHISEYVLKQWRELQSMSGNLREFPESLKEQMKTELNKELENEVRKIEKQYDEKLKIQESRQTERIKKTLKEKLLMLSKLKRKDKNILKKQ